MILAGLPVIITIGCIFSTFEPFFPNAAWVFVSVALLFGILNFWMSFIRPFVWRLTHRDDRGFRHVSGIPLVGTLFIVIASVLGFGSDWIGAVSLVATLLDTGGIPWFVFCTWTDRSFWDKKIQNQAEQGGAGNSVALRLTFNVRQKKNL